MTESRRAIIERRTSTTPSGCWEWDRIGPDGYGRAAFSGVSQIAHRAVWLILVGEIAPGMQLDHLCRNRACVNPAHLEPVSGLQNKRRSPITVNTLNVAKTHCPQGHPYEGGNLYERVNKKGGFRVCLACKRATDAMNQRRYRARRRAERDRARKLAS